MVTQSGNVGIGTTTPGSVLSVEGTSNWGVGEIIGNGTNAESSIGFRSSNVSKGGSGDWTIGANLSGSQTGSFDLYSASTGNVLSVLTGGNVGIGVANPGTALDINAGTTSGNGIRMTGASTDSNLQLINSTSGGVDWDFDTVGFGSLLGDGELSISAYGTNPLLAMQSVATIGGTGGGQIGINVPAAVAGGAIVAALDVRGNLATQPVASFSGASNFVNLLVDQSGSGDLFTASKSGATKFVITNAGNVGIGTTTFSNAATILQTVDKAAAEVLFTKSADQGNPGARRALDDLMSGKLAVD